MSEKRGSLSSSSLMLMTFTAVFSFGNIINNLYKDEVSALKVKYSYILINTNKSYTDFFNVLALDNRNNDYFFLSNIKILV